MRITPAQAAVLSERERQLLESRGPYEVKQLVTLIRRTRELRDKQRDLVQRQRVAATTRSRSKDSASVARTVRKEEIFSRALEHFEEQLQSLNRQCTEAMRELSLKARRAPVKKAAAAPAAGRKTATRKAARPAAAKKTATRTTATKRTGTASKATKKSAAPATRTARGGRSAEKARTRARAAR